MAAQPEPVTWPYIEVGNAKKSVKGEDFRVVSENVCWKERVHFSLFGVFDGHGGAGAASYCKINFEQELNSALTKLHESEQIPDDQQDNLQQWWFDNMPQALRDTFVSIDKECCARFAHAGTTASVLVLARYATETDSRPNHSMVEYFSANVGDSHSMLQVDEFVPGNPNAKTVVGAITEDHRVETNKKEQQRITEQGGSISRTGRETEEPEDKRLLGPLRMWPGGLMMSRTIGDRDAKCSSPIPKVFRGSIFISPETNAGAGARFVLASDGLWDALSFKATANEVKSKRAVQAANMLAQAAVKRAGRIRDDVTVIVVDVKPFQDMKGPFDNAFQDPVRHNSFTRFASQSTRARALSGALAGTVMWDPLESTVPDDYTSWIESSAALRNADESGRPAVPVIPADFVYGAKVAVSKEGDESQEAVTMFVIAVDTETGCVMVDQSLDLSSRSSSWVFADKCVLLEAPIFAPETVSENAACTTDTSNGEQTADDEWETVGPTKSNDDNINNASQQNTKTKENAGVGKRNKANTRKANRKNANNAEKNPNNSEKDTNNTAKDISGTDLTAAKSAKQERAKQPMKVNDLYIGGLSSSTSKGHIQSYFASFAPVRKVVLKTEQRSGNTFGFVTFAENNKQATQAVLKQAEPHLLNGVNIKVSAAIPKPAKVNKKKGTKPAQQNGQSNGKPNDRQTGKFSQKNKNTNGRRKNGNQQTNERRSQSNDQVSN